MTQVLKSAVLYQSEQQQKLYEMQPSWLSQLQLQPLMQWYPQQQVQQTVQSQLLQMQKSVMSQVQPYQLCECSAPESFKTCI